MCYDFVVCLETKQNKSLLNLIDCNLIPPFLAQENAETGCLSQTRQMVSFCKKELGREGECVKGRWGRLEGITGLRKQLHSEERKWFCFIQGGPQPHKSQEWVVAVDWSCFKRGALEKRHFALGKCETRSMLGRRELRSRSTIRVAVLTHSLCGTLGKLACPL